MGQLEAATPVQYMPLEHGVTTPELLLQVLPAGQVDEGVIDRSIQNLLGGHRIEADS
jgi:hypothetical protein